MTKPCVSIFMLTYNQEQFIAQAIEGVLMQKTNFHYQLVIGEDSSHDNTRRICEDYSRTNPVKIKLLKSDKNLGLIKNFIRTYRECDGKYVAICDGDDYWTDPLKLQKQVAFLEENSNYSLVFTSFKFLFPDGRFVTKNYDRQSENTGFEDLIFQNYICSATALFRNKKEPDDFPNWLEQCPYGDWPLYLWTTRKGERIRYMDEVTAVYRKEIGVSEKMKLQPSRIALANLGIVTNVNKDAYFIKFSKQYRESWKKHRKELLACLLIEGKVLQDLKFSLKFIVKVPMIVFDSHFYFIKKKLRKIFKQP